ncbi:cuticle protein-like [Toxorhynchites rutilus septentrionalis]|uniref:cuticle protein-like n=1 Tax=Toxorhynchites rutilus septentrionalis TaxID=329112 RepID=UPI002479F266|nr:cuticle protein-like [Toxorhynchites rutilus septentrionalis]
MASKMIALFATLACASAGYIEADHGHYSSAPAVSYSSVTHHTAPKLAVAKTVAYAEPAVHYAAPLTKTYAVHEPSLLKTVVAQPAYTKTILSEPVISHAAPLAYSQPAYTKTIVSQPAYTKTIVAEPAYTKTIVAQPTYAKTVVSEPVYTHAAKTLSYAPAGHVSHVSYDDSSAHYGW